MGGGGGVGGHKFKVIGRCQAADPIGTKFGTHVQIHLGMDIRQTNCPERHLGVLRCETFKSHGKLSNGWTDWHQIWQTSVDSSGNGHRLKQFTPRYPRAAFWVVLWDQQFKIL